MRLIFQLLDALRNKKYQKRILSFQNTLASNKNQENLLACQNSITPRLRELCINFTSKCKLKCTYCSAGKDGYQGFDIAETDADILFEFIRNNNVRSVVFGFYGDTLESDLWSKYANAILDLGITCRIHTALYRQLKPDEIKALSRFTTIATSVDTPDRLKQAHIRKGLDLRTLVYNIHLIKSYALLNHQKLPIFEFNCVYTNHVAFDLCDLITFAHSIGINSVSATDFCDFEQFETPYQSVLSLNHTEIRSIYNHVKKAISIANLLKIKFDFQFLDSLNRAAMGEKLNSQDPYKSNMYGNVSFYANTLKANQTRLCIKPWDNVSITPNGEVFPCCTYGENLGKISEDNSLESIFWGDKFNQLRKSLLNAENLPIYCKNCQAAPASSTSELVETLRIATTN